MCVCRDLIPHADWSATGTSVTLDPSALRGATSCDQQMHVFTAQYISLMFELNYNWSMMCVLYVICQCVFGVCVCGLVCTILPGCI